MIALDKDKKSKLQPKGDFALKSGKFFEKSNTSRHLRTF